MKVSGWDRFLVSVAPQWGVNRIRARAALEQLQRHYEAAQPGRRTSGWARSAADADHVIGPALVELRMHSRDLLRNNSWARRARAIVANNTAGWGIVPSATEVDETQAKAVMSLWKKWAASTECESEGRHTFYGMQHLAMRSMLDSGEVLIRRRWRRATDGLTIPLQLQVLESDFLDHSKNFLASAASGPTVSGIEFDKLGRRAAYWLYEQHPGSGRNATPSKRVPAGDILHVFDAERAGQARGVSWLAAAIVGMKDLDEYEDAELFKQKIAACFAAFVTDTDGVGSPIGEEDEEDDRLEKLEPGMIAHLPPGRQVTFGSPPTVTSDSFAGRQLRKVAAGVGITYEELSGDYSQVNFSSARMARLAEWGNIYHWQWNMLIPLLCGPVWSWAMEAAELAGELPASVASSIGVEWTCPPMPMIEPDKEGLALQRLVRVGAMTPSEMVRQQGKDPHSHWAEYAADLAVLDKMKITLDCDARLTTQAGMEQASETALNSPKPPAPKLLPAKKPAP